MDSQLSVYIIESGHTAYIIIADDDTGDRLNSDRFAVFCKLDLSIVVTGDTTCIISSCFPFVHDHVKYRVIVIGQVAGTVKDPCTILIVSDNTTRILLVAGCHTVVHAVFQDDIRVIDTGDATHIVISYYIIAVGGDRHTVVCTDGFCQIISKSSGDATHIIRAEHVAVLLRGTAVDHSPVTVAYDAAYIIAFQ